MESLKQTCNQLRQEADQAKTCLAAEIAGKAASAQHHSAQVSSESTLLASKIKDLETKLQHVESEASEPDASELKQL